MSTPQPVTSVDSAAAPVAATAAATPADPPTICELIRDISNGVRKAEDLDAETRQECVIQLSIDGFSNDEIACLLRVSERTVTRDRKAAWKTHGLQPDPLLGDELLGELQLYVRASLRRLSRLCNDQEQPPMVRVRADEAIGRIYQRFADLVRRFSYAEGGAERLAEKRADEEPLPPLTDDNYAGLLQAAMNRSRKRKAMRVHR